MDGVLNLGVRPTFGRKSTPGPVLELHLFGRRSGLYGRDIEVFFGPRLREEKKFPSPEALTRQIAADVERGRAILARMRPSGPHERRAPAVPKNLKESLYTPLRHRL